MLHFYLHTTQQTLLQPLAGYYTTNWCVQTKWDNKDDHVATWVSCSKSGVVKKRMDVVCRYKIGVDIV